ncbi:MULTISPECIES: hypothetical protein [Bifidobacterium]|uniref:hypothetical protein n=1 Tax=Bifidobacterium TaxID=1678 RepID=UPI0018DBD719|nr:MULTISPECIES: hypothetical protein [Bifidobacterium]MBH9980894.1 hypothetical protein [Bifidobacterium asteroides]MBI0098761.1 hypothetical protein [Bifidobacterium sp. W8114]
MSTASTIIAMRWSMTWGTIKHSSWQMVGAIISLLMAIAICLASWQVALTLGIWLPSAGPGDRQRMGSILVLFLAGLTLGVILIQLAFLGQGSNLSPSRFVLYGIPDSQLQVGLYLAGLIGPTGLTGLVCFLALTAVYARMGVGAAIVALVAALLAVMVMLALSRAVLDLVGTLMVSQRSRSGLYLLVTVVIMLLCLLPSLLDSGIMDGMAFDTDSLKSAADILAWTPLGAAVRLPEDFLSGSWWVLFGRLCMELATLALCFMIGMLCLRHDRLYAGASAERSAAPKGLGMLGRSRDTVDAMAARLLIYLRQDPRKLVSYPLLLVVVILYAIIFRQMPMMLWLGPIVGAWVLEVPEGNALAYDGLALHMEIASGVKGREDRLSRVRSHLSVALPCILLLGLVTLVFSGAMKGGPDLVISLDMLAATIGLLLSGLGVAQVFSALLIYPVPSMDQPFTSPQGRAVAQGFLPMLQLLASLVIMLPTLLVALPTMITGGILPLWLPVPVALANGLIVLAVGVALGSRIFDRRQSAILLTLDRYASLQS